MTLNKLINELQEAARSNPARSSQEVFIYITDIEALPDNGESPISIKFVDNSISDRVDINI